MQKNSARFVRTEVITVPQNSGIAANCNRGVNAAEGTWIKFIAGDDILTADCVDSFVDFVKLNREAKVVESKSLFFRYVFDESNFYHVEDQGGDVFFHQKQELMNNTIFCLGEIRYMVRLSL